ncbi:MAG: hypothetical protein Q9210_007348 [Variospora velana]
MDISNRGVDDEAKLANRNYIRCDAGVESIPENEEDDIKAVADMINPIQKAQWNCHRRVVKGSFIVHDHLPKHLKQSMFDHGAEYPVVCRYISEPGDPGLDDRIPQPRGFARKVFGLDGHFLPGGVGIPTQDIEFNSTPALDLADAKTTREIIDLRIKYGNNQPELYKHLEARPDTHLQKFRDSIRNTHLESTRQYSQTAFRFGDYIAKYCLVPSSETQKKLYDETLKPDEHGSDILSQWLQNFHREHDAEYVLQFQLCENLEDQPVEYAGKVRDPEKYPWQTVATLVVPRQDSFDWELKNFWEDHIRVDPWHGLKTTQPLGSPSRLKRVGAFVLKLCCGAGFSKLLTLFPMAVYPTSSALRRKMNVRPEVNVTTMAEVP